MKLCDLLRRVPVIDIRTKKEYNIRLVETDSRRVEKGCMFLAKQGLHRDGDRYIEEAIRKGAEVILCSRDTVLPEGIDYIRTDNTLLAESLIFSELYGNPTDKMYTVAVTGTNGKTSVAFMLKEIFKASGKNVGLISTVGTYMNDRKYPSDGGSSLPEKYGRMTTPDPEIFYKTAAKLLEDGAEVLVFEASSHALDRYKIHGTHPDIAVFTNLSPEHLDYHGDMDAYFAAKARLHKLSKSSVINTDDKYMRSLMTEKDLSVSPSGRNADAMALRPRQTRQGTEYMYCSERAVFTVRTPLLGDFTVENSALAITAALHAGASAETVRDAMDGMPGIPGRLEIITPSDCPICVIIDYAHTPAALERVLKTLKNRGRLTVLFGCGGERDRSKRRQMGAIASSLADFTVITGDNSRGERRENIISEILSGIDKEKPYTVIGDREAAIRYTVRNADIGDTVLLAGKGHEEYEITADGIHPFSEKEIVKSEIERRFYRK